MVKLVLTSGCSFTAGVELADYKDNWKNGLEESELVWSYQIKKNLWKDALFFNAAKSGASNTTITRKTLYYLNQFLNSYKPEEIVVLIMWTGVHRREWRLPNKTGITYEMSDFNYENTTVTDSFNLKQKNMKKIMKSFYHPKWTNFRYEHLVKHKLDKVVINYYENLVNEKSSLYDTLKNIEYLNFFLDKNKIKCYYTTADRHILDYSKFSYSKDMFLDRLIASVDPNRNFFTIDNQGFSEFSEKYPMCEFGHPDKEAHYEFAKRMTKWIEEN
jgi:hypothetical protein